MPTPEENAERFKRVADLTTLGRIAYERATEQGMTIGEKTINAPRWDELLPSLQDFWINIADAVVETVAGIWLKNREEKIFRDMTENFEQD